MSVPTDIAGLMCWYKADAIVGKVDLDPITQWDDSSVNARHATGTGPVYRTGLLNALPIVRFDGVDDSLQAVAFTQTEQWSAFAVANCSRATPSDVIASTDTEIRHAQLLRYNGTNAESIAFNTAVAAFTDAEPATAASFQVLSAVRDATSIQVWVNGTSGGSTATTGTPQSGSTTLFLGTRSASQFLQGDVAEVFLFDTALSGTDRQLMEEYLNTKWFMGLQQTAIWPYNRQGPF